MEKIHFFYHSKSPFSNFHPAPFVLDGLYFSCTEQYYAFQKAKFFGDVKMAKKILNIKNPFQIKQMGRHVRGFNYTTWKRACKKIMERGNRAKYLQNLILKQKLLKTHPQILAESSPNDRFWDTGPIMNNEKWSGQNYLGKILMKIRQSMLSEPKNNISGNNNITCVTERKEHTAEQYGKKIGEESVFVAGHDKVSNP